MEKIKNVDLKVVGVTFKNEDGTSRGDIIRELSERFKGMHPNVLLEREYDNKFDKNAIKVIVDEKQIGYIGKDYAQILAEFMDAGRKFTANVKDCGIYKNRPYCEITVQEV